MTKVLFAGPSLHGLDGLPPGIERRPPAAQGDILAAVLQGANVVGLVDGLFETVAAVWHKEILHALSQGVAVLGAASLGALRAAECHEFGMVAVGEIARRYVEGELDDDAAVAQLHGPAELGFVPLTEALVDCEAQVDALLAGGLLDRSEAADLLRVARKTFFKDRTWRAILERSDLGVSRQASLLDVVRRSRIGLKRIDALLLVRALAAMPDERGELAAPWTLSETPSWKRSHARIVEATRRGIP